VISERGGRERERLRGKKIKRERERGRERKREGERGGGRERERESSIVSFYSSEETNRVRPGIATQTFVI